MLMIALLVYLPFLFGWLPKLNLLQPLLWAPGPHFKSWAMNHCYCNSRMLKLSSSLPPPSCAYFSSHPPSFLPPSPLLSPTSVVGPNPPTLPGLKHYHHLDYCPFPLLESLPSPVSCISETYLAWVLLSLLLTDPSSARWPAWLAAWAAVILPSMLSHLQTASSSSIQGSSGVNSTLLKQSYKHRGSSSGTVMVPYSLQSISLVLKTLSALTITTAHPPTQGAAHSWISGIAWWCNGWWLSDTEKSKLFFFPFSARYLGETLPLTGLVGL